VREKVGVDEDGVGGAEGGVGLEEEGGGDLGAGVCQLVLKLLVGKLGVAYISRLAWASCFFFSASISPAIWFFFLRRGSAGGVLGVVGASVRTVGHRVGLCMLATKSFAVC
jgi:hypothetical protein